MMNTDEPDRWEVYDRYGNKIYADLLLAEHNLVIHTLTTPSVNNWLDISVVQTMPDSPFIVTHLSTSSQQVLNLIPVAA